MCRRRHKRHKRHSCATILLAAGVNVKIVSERLGHANVSLTLNTYSHVLPTMQEGASNVINQVFIQGDGLRSGTGS